MASLRTLVAVLALMSPTVTAEQERRAQRAVVKARTHKAARRSPKIERLKEMGFLGFQ